MKVRALFLITAIALVFCTCDNFFHDLVPPDGDRIESFSVPGQMSVEIGENTITAYVLPGTDLTNLIPSIRVSSGATLFPVTLEYAFRAFADERTFGAAMQLSASVNITDTVFGLIRENKDRFTRPVMDLPINFNGYPVDFLVISGLGTIRNYKVRVEIDTGEGKFTSFKFDKFYNPEVVVTATGGIDTASKTVTVNVSYPVENIASYQLTPSFETNGARVYLDGREWRSGETLVDFLKPPDSSDLSNPDYATQTKILTLKRMGYDDVQWTLIVNFSEDPNTDNRITDFRFSKTLNPLINADYMATIYNSSNGTTGSIDVTVFYSGARPEELRANFISPGTVTVGGNTQTSGYSMQDFSNGYLQYVVTSRVGGYVRTYYVSVNILPVVDFQITYFSFRTEQNPGLSSSSIGLIDHNSRTILIEAAYAGDTPPYELIPQFTANRVVSVNDVRQYSGNNNGKQDFSGPVRYVVSASLNESNPTLKREYRVDVRFVNNLSSGAEITTYTFYKADNPGLIADVQANISQTTGAITATLLFETPGGDRTLIPRWTAQGRIESNGVIQTSGESGKKFYTPQAYRASSADGVFQRNYTVTIREKNNRIYVKHDAAGRNDGTNWENAYRKLYDGLNDGNYFYNYPDVMKEVWIAEGTYAVMYGSLYADTSYIGGFRGNEESVSARIDPANHRAVITEDRSSYEEDQYGRLLGGHGGSSTNHVYSFENLIFTDAGRSQSFGTGIYIYTTRDNSNLTIRMTNLDFNNLSGNRGSAIYILGEYRTNSVIMNNCTFSNTRTESYAGAVYISNTDSVIMNNCTFSNTRSESYSGAVNINRGNTVTVRDSTFLDCFAYRDFDIGVIASDNTLITNCTFQNTIPHPFPEVDIGRAEDGDNFLKTILQLGGGTTIVDNCKFINLQTNQDRNASYVISFPGTNANVSLTIQNSEFTLTHPYVSPLWTRLNTNLDGVAFTDSSEAVHRISVRYGANIRWRSGSLTFNGIIASDDIIRAYHLALLDGSTWSSY